MEIESVQSSHARAQTVSANGSGNRAPNLNGIAAALRAGDVSAAQGDSTVIRTSPAGQSAMVANDLTTLENALKAKDIAAAQAAFTSLKQHFNLAPLVPNEHIDTKA